MQVGDMIYDSHFKEHGLVVDVTPVAPTSVFHGKGDWCSILYQDGQTVRNIRSWEESIEVISASR